MRPLRFLALFAAALPAACAVGPNYRKPQTSVPSSYAGAALVPAPAATATAADLHEWWAQFHDPDLSALIARAMRGNLALKATASRVREARERVLIAGAGRLPQVNADAQASRLHLSQNAGLSQFANLLGGGRAAAAQGPNNGFVLPGGNITTFTVGFDASWEIDLFGGTRRAIQAAQAAAQQSVWSRRDSEVSLAAEVASDYWLLRALQRRSAIAGDEVKRQEEALAVLQARRRYGFVTDQDVRAQAAQVASAKAALPDLDARREAQVHALGVLIGEPPQALETQLSAAKPLPPPPPTIPAGLPSDLLRRRPDVRAAERALAASSAQIGVAVADLYPKLDLTGALDLVSLDLRHLLEGSSHQYSAGGALSWPLFAGGRGRAGVRVAKEQNQQALYAYQRTVLNALKDVEDALTRYGDELRKNRALRDTLSETQRATEISLAQQRAGVINVSPVLTAQGAMLQAQNQLAQSDGALDRDLVSLYKALGGGWR